MKTPIIQDVPTKVVGSGAGFGEVRYRVTADDIRTHRVTICGPHGVKYRETKDEAGEVVELECDHPCFFRVLPNVKDETRRQKSPEQP